MTMNTSPAIRIVQDHIEPSVDPGMAQHLPGGSSDGWVRDQQPPRGGLPPGALRRVRETMECRLTEKLPLRELAVVAGVSEWHFARAFKQSIGHPPHRYLMMRRIAIASVLIETTDRSLIDISLEVGFADQSHFTRMFARITRETPGAYRRRHR